MFFNRVVGSFHARENVVYINGAPTMCPGTVGCFTFVFSLIPSNSPPYDMESNYFIGNKNDL